MTAGMQVTVCGILGLLLTLVASDTAAEPAPFDVWLTAQAAIESWSADVEQVRYLAALAQPVRAEGRVWFVRPHRFRWQLGDPPRTIAVRNEGELGIAYPPLQRFERHAYGTAADSTLQRVLALLELGLPSDPQRFRQRYELLSTDALDDSWRFLLAPRDSVAQRFIERIVLEVDADDNRLLATELVFPDGTRMRNEFTNHQVNAQIDESLFDLSLLEKRR